MKPLPEQFLNKMSSEDRRRIRQPNGAEREATLSVKSERDLHNLIIQELNRREIFYTRARMDKRSTIAGGAPDFTFVVNGCPVAVEVKIGSRKLEPEQDQVREKMIGNGWRYEVVRSFDSFLMTLQVLQASDYDE